MTKQVKIQEDINQLFETLGQEIAQGVTFGFVPSLVEELKAEYARIINLKTYRRIREEKAAYLNELEKLVRVVQGFFLMENNQREDIPAWARNTEKAEVIGFYENVLIQVPTLTLKHRQFILLMTKHEMEYYEEVLKEIKALESQRGTKQDYLMLLKIRRVLIEVVGLV